MILQVSRPRSSPQSVRDLLAAIAESAPFEQAAGWDPVGLQLGDPAAAVSRVAVCHEVTGPVVSAVEAQGFDLLVSYHPLLFHPVRQLLAGQTPGGRALRLARCGAALAVVHTAFDVAPGGASDALASALALRDLRGFGPVLAAESLKIVTFLPEAAADSVLDAVVGQGAGRIGGYSHCSYRTDGTGTFFAGRGTRPVVGRQGELNREPEIRLEFTAPRSREAEIVAALVAAHPYEQPVYDVYDRRGDSGMAGRIGRIQGDETLAAFVERARAALASPRLRVAGDPERLLGSVAVVPGSGGDFLDLAAEAGVDALLTGDLGHHRAREGLDRGLCLIDAGHVASERPGLERLLSLIRGLIPGAESLLGLDPDPWRL